MKRKIISIILLGLVSLNLSGCWLDAKTYNSASAEDLSNSTDKRIKTSEGLSSNFELLSLENVTQSTTIAIVRDKETKQEYIISEIIGGGVGGTSITPRLKEQK